LQELFRHLLLEAVNCLHMTVVCKIVAAKILLQRWTQMIIIGRRQILLLATFLRKTKPVGFWDCHAARASSHFRYLTICPILLKRDTNIVLYEPAATWYPWICYIQ